MTSVLGRFEFSAIVVPHATPAYTLFVVALCMAAIHAALFGCTGRSVIGAFQTVSFGRTGHPPEETFCGVYVSGALYVTEVAELQSGEQVTEPVLPVKWTCVPAF